ncbi:MAG: hypothetical protein AAF743_14570 [Planctomycetota bacterium]
MFVNEDELTIGMEPGDDGVPRRSVYVAVPHVVEVEPIKEKLQTPQEPGEGQDD